jgi:hypothetical protein
MGSLTFVATSEEKTISGRLSCGRTHTTIPPTGRRWRSYHPTRSAAGQGRRTPVTTLFVVAVVNGP